MDGDRRAALRAAKLAALVRDERGEGATNPAVYPGGAALARGTEGWVYADERPLRSLGGALAWAAQHDLDELHLVVDEADAAGHLARRATYFDQPPTVWVAHGRALVRAEPSAPPVVEPVAADIASHAAFMRRIGAVPVDEHGILAGEVYGLEVCRAFRDPETGAARLEVGVGAADREAFRLIHGDDPPADAAIEIVGRIAQHRRPGAPGHALNRLAAERRLRHALIEDPGRIGARLLAAVPPPLPRTNLKDPTPCVAAGIDGDGSALVVVCAVGVDLDVVVVGADARATVDARTAGALGRLGASERPELTQRDRSGSDEGRNAAAPSRLVIVVPERDVHPALTRLMSHLREPGEIRVAANS